jgi:hypothetical protein
LKNQKEIITLSSISTRNLIGNAQIKSILKKAELLKSDQDQEQRIGKSLCICCYYVNNARIAGCAITDRQCGLCETVMRFSSTATDVTCLDCAKRNDICKQCGADIDLTNRKRSITAIVDQ